MGGLFKRVAPGSPLSAGPTRKAAWVNAVSESAEYYRNQIAGGEAKGHRGIQTPVAFVGVKNVSGSHFLRGDAVQLGASLLAEVDPRAMWLEADSPAEPIERRLAIMRRALKNGETAADIAQVSGVCVATVNVTNVEHTHATPQTSSFVLASGLSGPLELLSFPDGTGEQSMIVKFAGGSGSALRYCAATTTITAEAGGTVGGGTVQPKRNDGGLLINDGDPVDIVNLHPLQFESGWRGYIDESKDPPEAVVFTCVPEA